MPMDRTRLEAIATDYVCEMTSIRGRRVHRLILREFAGSEAVLAATAEAAGPALVAIKAHGAIAVCQTDGSGKAAPIVDLPAASPLTVTTQFDLLKDSLPIVGWSLWHPALVQSTGTLTVSADGLDASEIARIAGLLKPLEG